MWICARPERSPLSAHDRKEETPSRPQGAKEESTATYPQTTRPGESFTTIAALISRCGAPITYCLIRTRVRLVLGPWRANHAHARVGHRLCAGIWVAPCWYWGAGMNDLRVLGRVAMGVGLHGWMCRDALSVRGVHRRVGRASGVVGWGRLLLGVRVHRKRTWCARCVPRGDGRRPSARNSLGILVRKLKTIQMRRGGLTSLMRRHRPRQLLWKT